MPAARPAALALLVALVASSAGSAGALRAFDLPCGVVSPASTTLVERVEAPAAAIFGCSVLTTSFTVACVDNFAQQQTVLLVGSIASGARDATPLGYAPPAGTLVATQPIEPTGNKQYNVTCSCQASADVSKGIVFMT